MTIPVFDEPDRVLAMSIREHEARVYMVRTTGLTQEAADTHLASDTAIAAMGRFLSAAALLDPTLGAPGGSVTVTVDGDGVGGRMTAVAAGGDLKIAVRYPQAELPPLPGGGEDAAGFVGRRGRLTVVRDYGFGDPYVGVSELVSGELGEDFAHYLARSEQQPSVVALGCQNGGGRVFSAGGILIQALPGMSAATLADIERRVPFAAYISREIYDRPLKGLAESWFAGLDLRILDERPLRLHCGCTRERMRAVLKTLGREELEQAACKGEEIPVSCHFCRARHVFGREELLALAEEMEPSEAGNGV